MAATKQLQIVLTAKDLASKELGKLNSNLKNLQPTFRKMALVGTVSFATIGTGLFKATQAATDAQEIFNKFDVVFQDVSKESEAVAKDLRDNFGLAESSAKDLLSSTGDMLTGFGLSGAAALDLAEKTNKLAVDLASFTNIEGGAEGASKALTKALLGERESVKELGIAILEEDVKAKIAAMEATGAFTDETDRQKKAIATLEIAVSQSKNAIGDFARTSDSLANQQRVLKERFKETTEELGKVFMPIMQKIVERILPVVENIAAWIKENPKLTQTIAFITLGLVALLAIVGTLGLILPAIITGFTLLGGAITIAMGPVGLIAIAIAGLIALGIVLVKNWDKVRAAAVTAWEAIGSIVNSVWEGIKSGIKESINWIIDKLNFFVRQANKIQQTVNKVPGVSIPLIPEIPKLAKGGIVTGPTLAQIGEAGPEAVIPLDKFKGLGGIRINITGTFMSEDAAEEMGNLMIDKLKLQGAL